MGRRAVVIVNPNATTTTQRTRDVLAAALGNVVDAIVVMTQGRHHASEIARKAVVDGVDLVIVLGGDGTVNETVNGLLADATPTPDAARIPILAVVPGGNANVFARALGLPADPVEATGALLEALAHGRARTIGLGRIGHRYFTFGAGIGIDAEVVDLVETRRRDGAASTTALWLRTAARRLLTRRALGAPTLTIRPGPDARDPGDDRGATRDLETSGLGTLVVSNTSPWTYLGSRPVHASPRASFDLGLDALAVRSPGRTTTVRAAVGLLRSAGPAEHLVERWHDIDRLEVRSTGPVAAQVDGDFLGRFESLDLAAVPDALRVAVL